MADLHIDLTSPVITDLTRLWKAQRDSAPRPSVPPEEAATLHAAYQTAATNTRDTRLAAFYRQRAREAAAAQTS